ncbi:hypothetical protein GS532_16785 [Rhodococcus hoagii]|uniref:Head-to-tail stopper n=1 Tax=Rhodococcus hoagii TaxID=43767 RepID=A0AAE3BBL1_RHOHA|nr:hypothetical protein [Prescottella equi]MBM4685491.1 hypothetical protein [Prescottella equi]MBM4716171.1 hypothetical protein [Prescottella equi]
MTDPLEHWWRWPVMVERHAGEGADGPVFDPPVVVAGRISAKRKKVLAPDGTEVISEARVSMSATTPLIPPGSRVTLPDPFGGRTAEVLAEQPHHDGAGLTPNFYSIDLT